MPLFMDIQTAGDPLSVDDVAKAHAADLQVQGQYGVHYLGYWVDETHGKVFCLTTPPTPAAPPPSTERHTAWSRMKSTWSPKGHDTAVAIDADMIATALAGTWQHLNRLPRTARVRCCHQSC